MGSSNWPPKGGGSGDVSGPGGGSTDNAIARWDGATGKALQNSVVFIDDAGNVTSALINADNNTITNLVDASIKAGANIQFSKMESLAVNRLVITSGSGTIIVSAVTATEAGYLAGVTSSIQTQLNGKLNLSGGTMTGDLVLNADPDTALKAATKQYVDGAVVLYGADGDGVKLSGTTFFFSIDGSTLSQSASGAKVADGGITNTQVNTSAAIARSKLANGTAYRLLANNASGVMAENAAITGNRAVASDSNGQLVASATTATELGYVNGVTSAIQTQLDAIRAIKGNVAISSDVTLTDKRLHLVDTSAARSLALPAANANLYLVVKDSTSSAQTNPITLTTPGSEKIDGENTAVIDWNNGSFTIVSDGSDYFII